MPGRGERGRGCGASGGPGTATAHTAPCLPSPVWGHRDRGAPTHPAAEGPSLGTEVAVPSAPKRASADACPALSRGLDFRLGRLGGGWSPCRAKAPPTPAVTHGELSAFGVGVPSGVPGLGVLSPAPRMECPAELGPPGACQGARNWGAYGGLAARGPRLRSCTPWHRAAPRGWSALRPGQKTATVPTRAAANPSLGGVQTPEIPIRDGATSHTALPVQPAAFWELCEDRALLLSLGASRRHGIRAHLPTLAKGRGWGGPSIEVPGHSPLPSPPLVSHPPLKAQRRPLDPAAEDVRMRPPAQAHVRGRSAGSSL